MLYDPKWEKPEVKADPFSLESLIAWLETKNPAARYDYNDCDGMCLFGQYAIETTGTHWRQPDCPFHYENFDVAFDRFSPGIAIGAGIASWTFGAALTRARNALAEHD